MGIARLAKQEGCRHFHLLSSQGANENSFFLYPQVKVGFVSCEVENFALGQFLGSNGKNNHRNVIRTFVNLSTSVNSIEEISFIYQCLFSVLMVERAEHRLFESWLRTILSYTVQRIAPEWITTPIDVLARAMCWNTFTKDRPNVEVLDNHAIFRLAEGQETATGEEKKTNNEL